jgi:hypothetical protein
VVVGGGRDLIDHAVLMLRVHRVVVVLALTGGLIVMGRGAVETVLGAGGCSRRQLEAGALPPSRRGGDQRKCDGQNEDLAKNTTHPMMLAVPTEGRHGNVLAITDACGATWRFA